MSDIKCMLDALGILVSTSSQSSNNKSGNKNATSTERFQAMLAQNMERLQNTIDSDQRFASLKNVVTHMHVGHGDISWSFVTCCLQLLNSIQQSIHIASKSFTEGSKSVSNSKPLTPNQAPAMSPDFLSISQQKTILTTLQFIACLGLCPNLQDGVGIPIHRRSGFTSVFKQDSVLSENERCSRLMDCVKVLMQCVDVSCLGMLILSRHLSDLLAALLQLSFGSRKKIIKKQPFIPQSAETLTPASVVDRVIKQSLVSVDDSVEHKLSSEQNKLSDINTHNARTAVQSKQQWNKECMDLKDELGKSESNSVKTDVKHENHLHHVEAAEPDLDPSSVVEGIHGIEHQPTDAVRLCVSEEEANRNDESVSTIHSKRNSLDVTTKCNSPPVSDTNSDINDIPRPQYSQPTGSIPASSYSSAGEQDEVSDAEFCESSLQHLLDHVSPSVLVRELIVLQGGPSLQSTKEIDSSAGSMVFNPSPPWLRKACGRLLSSILMKPKGVVNVLRGMLDPSLGDPTNWKKCDAIAKILSRCPMSVSSVEEYYKLVCPQILLLLLHPDHHDAGYFLRVTCSFMREVIKRHPQLAQMYLMEPLMRPLVACVQGQVTGSTAGKCIVVQDKQLKICIQSLYKVTVVSSEVNSLISPYLQPVMQLLFHLFSYCRTHTSQLGSSCFEILISFLKHSDHETSLTLLLCLAFGEERKNSNLGFCCLHPSLSFHTNSSEGIEIIVSDAQKMSQSDDADDLTELVDGLVDVVKQLEQGGIAGEFFLTLLKELTEMISSEMKPAVMVDKSVSKSGQELLDIERRQEEEMKMFRKRLIILNLLASMCDKLGPACLKSTRHILQFIKTTLERAVELLKLTDDAMMTMFETETVSMALGLLTAVMSGDELVSDGDHDLMLELLPLLEEIHLNHPDETVQEMAADIRIAIATRGAVWSDLIKPEADDLKVMSEKVKSMKTLKKMKSNPASSKFLVEVLPDSEEQDQQSARQFGPPTTDDIISDTQVNVPAATFQHNHVRSGKKQLGDYDVSSKHDSSPSVTSQCVPSSNIVHHSDLCKNVTKDHDVNAEHDSSLRESYKSDSTSDATCKNLPKDINVDRGNASLTSSNNGACSNLCMDLPESTSTSELQQAFTELCDPLIPVRGHGLLRLTKLVQSKSRDVDEKKETILNIFLENIDHSDTYLYLASVNGLVALANRLPERVIPTLAQEFADFDSDERKIKRSVELRLKLGEALVKASRNLGDMIPAYRDILLSAILCGVRDADDDMRASSLSNLAEVCRLLHFSLGSVLHEIFCCCCSVLRSDKSASVRKAAVLTLTSLLQGLGNHSLQVLSGVLRDLYRLLKHVYSSDSDEGVRFHAQLALNELDAVAQDALFPKQTLQKKITVLHPD